MASKSDYNKKYNEKESPYPVRLGELKPKLQQEAFEKDTSIHSLLKDIVSKHYQEEIDNPYAIEERVKKAREKMQAELDRIKSSATRFIEVHEKILSAKGSGFLISSQEIPDLQPDIEAAVKSIKEKIEIRIEELRKELLSRNGVDLIAFSEREIPLLKPDIDSAVQPLRKKIATKVEKLRQELQMTGS